MGTLNTQKTRLDGQLKESLMSVRKLADEKKQIITQLEEVSNKSSTMEKQLQEANKKLEISDKSIKTLQDEMNQKLKESTNAFAAANEQNKDLQLQIESKSSLLKDLSQQ